MEEIKNEEVETTEEVAIKEEVETTTNPVETEEVKTETEKVKEETPNEDKVLIGNLSQELDSLKSLLNGQELSSVLEELETLKQYKTGKEEEEKKVQFDKDIKEALNGRELLEAYKGQVEFSTDKEKIKEQVNSVYAKMMNDLKEKNLLSTIGGQGSNPAPTKKQGSGLLDFAKELLG
ncbi:hypothetical protein ACIQVU_07935 [Lysinibacillus sp. NPDC098008]|uniref:hypothetical protein n=1 Tax=Lysinibacillus sp. NPDC098008 TaxID=3364146 RepID=UPI0037F90940